MSAAAIVRLRAWTIRSAISLSKSRVTGAAAACIRTFAWSNVHQDSCNCRKLNGALRCGVRVATLPRLHDGTHYIGRQVERNPRQVNKPYESQRYAVAASTSRVSA